jgi:hypothetical protein
MPTASATANSIQIAHPGEGLGLLEVRSLKNDSIFGYPSEEVGIKSYTIVERKNFKKISPDAVFSIQFNKPHEKYCWKIRENANLADFHYSDTIILKPSTWYKLVTKKYKFSVYFSLDSSGALSFYELKPDSGAY